MVVLIVVSSLCEKTEYPFKKHILLSERKLVDRKDQKVFKKTKISIQSLTISLLWSVKAQI